jgi:hypothetical protein
MTLGAAFVAAGIATAVLNTGAASPPPDRFTLGVLRRDGLVTPFATFDGKRWRGDWPAPRRGLNVPVTMSAVPSKWWGPLGPRETWQAWIGPPEPVVLHTRRPEVYDAQCLPQIGLRTDYRSSEPFPGRDARPYPKDGLAVSPPYPIDRIDIMPIGAITPPLVDAFNSAESIAVLGARNVSIRKLLRKQREAVPITIDAVYAAGDLSARVYYFEIVRQYDSPDPQRRGQCDGLSYGAGWFARDANGPIRRLSFEVVVTSCDRDGLLYMLPLGAVRAGGRFFWIAQWSGWNFEQYNIVEIKPTFTEDVVKVSGGGC